MFLLFSLQGEILLYGKVCPNSSLSAYQLSGSESDDIRFSPMFEIPCFHI